MIFDVFLQEHTKETTPVTLTESDLSQLLAALKAGESPRWLVSYGVRDPLTSS